MNGLRSTNKLIGFYAAPERYHDRMALYVMSKQGIKKVATFSNNDSVKLFIETLEELFEESTANWSLIGPCKNWEHDMDARGQKDG